MEHVARATLTEVTRNLPEMYCVYLQPETQRYILEALCGGIGMYECAFVLNADEVAWLEGRPDLIERLVGDLCRKPERFADRAVLVVHERR